MREFILRSLKGKTSEFSLDDLPQAGRMDLVARCVSNALWVAGDLRRDTVIHVVLDGPAFPPKIVSFSGASLEGLDYDEQSIASFILLALKKGKDLQLGGSLEAHPGIKVAKKSFEALVREKAKSSQLVYLHQKGKDIRESSFKEDVTFVFGDYIGMPRLTEKLLERLGAEKVSLGPKMLFASATITLAHYELDRK